MKQFVCWHKLIFILLFTTLAGKSYSFHNGSAEISLADSLQKDSIPYNKKKMIVSHIVHGVGYGGSLAALAGVWYKDFQKTKLHAFNDMDEWGGMDKAGHVNTAWQISNFSFAMYRNAGMKEKKAAFVSSGVSMLYLTTLEFFDGYSADWGFSFGDMGANIIGSSLAYLRNTGKIRNVHLKWSYFETKYPPYRPDVLGHAFHERMLKDYNGQNYWLSVNMPGSWFADGSRNWLCFSVGYSIDGFTGGKQNYFDESVIIPPTLSREGEFYLSVDIDFSKLNIRNKWLKNVLKVFNVIKIPAPAIGFSTGGKLLVKPFYF